jgi:hypothetical protein
LKLFSVPEPAAGVEVVESQLEGLSEIEMVEQRAPQVGATAPRRASHASAKSRESPRASDE